MSSAISIGVSGMQAATARLNAAASNIANAQTRGAMPGTATAAPLAYQPVDVVHKDIGNGSGQPAGVGYSYVTRPNGVTQTYDPEAPGADAAGMVGTPDIDIASELVSAMIAKYDFEASARMVSVASAMQKTAIDMKV